MLPMGKVGRQFIEEVTSLFKHFNDGSALEPVAFSLISLIFPLLLQKPSQRSKAKDHVRYLEKRLVWWKEGKLQDLLDEGRAIQSSLSKSIRKNTTKNNDKKYDRFVKLMEQGKIDI